MPTASLSTGVEMYYEERGSGTPLLLHYGTGGDHAAWEPQVEQLSAAFRVITPDPRGTGKTGGRFDRWTMAAFAEDVIALLDSLSIERVHIGGMSMGSAVCQEIAIRHPKRVDRLVLSNTWGQTDRRLRLLWEHSLFVMEAAANAPATEQEAWQTKLYEHGIATFFSSDALERREDMIAQWWHLYSSGLREDAGRGHWDAMLSHNALSRLPGVTAPTLIIAGEEDYFGLSHPRQVHNAIPGATLEVMRDSGSSHGLLWERADEANQIIGTFLSESKAT